MLKEGQPVTRAVALRTSVLFAVALGAGLTVTSMLNGWSVWYPTVAVPLVVVITFLTNYYTTRHRYKDSGTWTD
jgi:sterol desaturase/sphingolipid hydroxylase (fatty acid hydroxylase superfamily)